MRHLRTNSKVMVPDFKKVLIEIKTLWPLEHFPVITIAERLFDTSLIIIINKYRITFMIEN